MEVIWRAKKITIAVSVQFLIKVRVKASKWKLIADSGIQMEVISYKEDHAENQHSAIATLFILIRYTYC